MIKTLSTRHYGKLMLFIITLGFLLRIASASGGLWRDEAWSAQMATAARTPLGVLLAINHDNNHHLNSLWLQFVGFGADPLVARALAIVAGTVAIGVAARLAPARAPTFSLILALMVAVSPMMVTIGSEARGYAPMVLTLLVAASLVSGSILNNNGDDVRIKIAMCFGLGALSQLTMVVGCVALIGWTFLTLWQHTTLKEAARRTLTLFLPAVATVTVVIGVVLGAAHRSPTGFQFGSYEPFTTIQCLRALAQTVASTIGYPAQPLWLIVAASLLTIAAHFVSAQRIWLYRLSIIGFPVAVEALRVGNPGYPRYYLIVSIALSIMIAEMIAAAIDAADWERRVGLLALIAITIGSLQQDVALIVNQRADPDRAVKIMMARVHAGTRVLIDQSSSSAVLNYSAAHLSFPLLVIEGKCQNARFLFVDGVKGGVFAEQATRCGQRYDRITVARTVGLSGTEWALYEDRSKRRLGGQTSLPVGKSLSYQQRPTGPTKVFVNQNVLDRHV